jgi:hypothetical protein
MRESTLETRNQNDNAPLAQPAAYSVPPNRQQPDNRWLLAWNRRSFLELGSYEKAAGCARGHVRNLLAEWNRRQHSDLAQLIISELITNSVVAVRALRWVELPPVRMWVLGDASRVNLLVWDALPGAPQARIASQDEEKGRGLFLVQELSAAWGSYLPPEAYHPAHAGGKVTWAIIGGPREGTTR